MPQTWERSQTRPQAVSVLHGEAVCAAWSPREPPGLKAALGPTQLYPLPSVLSIPCFSPLPPLQSPASPLSLSVYEDGLWALLEIPWKDSGGEGQGESASSVDQRRTHGVHPVRGFSWCLPAAEVTLSWAGLWCLSAAPHPPSHGPVFICFCVSSTHRGHITLGLLMACGRSSVCSLG